MSESTKENWFSRSSETPSGASKEEGREGFLHRGLFVPATFIFVSLVANLALLGVIGYLNQRDETVKETEESQTWTLREVQISRPDRQPARKPPPESKIQPDNTSNRASPEKPNPVKTPDAPELDPRSLNVGDLQLDVMETVRTPVPNSVLVGSEPPGRSKRGETRNGDGDRHREATSSPRKVAGPRPAYPASARRKEIEGYVLLSIDISREGRVTRARVLEFSGSPAFKRAARKAVRKWLFEPARKDGDPVPVTRRQRIQFRLRK